MAAGAHVEEGQQHLGGGDLACAQQAVVHLVELALPHGAGGLQLVHRPGPERDLHHAHSTRDRATRDDHHLAAGVMELGQLVA